MKKLKILVAVVASIAMIAIGQRHQTENKQKEPRTQKAQVQDIDSDVESWFV